MRRALAGIVAIGLLMVLGVLGWMIWHASNGGELAPEEAARRGMDTICLGGGDRDGTRKPRFFAEAVGDALPEGNWARPPTLVDRNDLEEASQSLNLAANLHRGPAINDCAALFHVLSLYRKHHGESPVGGHRQLVLALCGANPRRIAYLSPTHPKIDEKGRLLDRWGKPFFFHQLSGDLTEVISRGPDGKLFTEDDLKIP